jgi:hypothetical protein
MATFQMDIEGIPEFRQRLKDFPLTGEKKMTVIANRISKRLRNQMRARIPIGPGRGPRFDYRNLHSREAIKGHGGAINWGMYIRVGIDKSDAAYPVLIWNEEGTNNRKLKRNAPPGWKPKKGSKFQEFGARGNLSAKNIITNESRVIIASAHFYVAEVEKALEEACKG